jgi:hypothetical protein
MKQLTFLPVALLTICFLQSTQGQQATFHVVQIAPYDKAPPVRLWNCSSKGLKGGAAPLCSYAERTQKWPGNDKHTESRRGSIQNVR